MSDQRHRIRTRAFGPGPSSPASAATLSRSGTKVTYEDLAWREKLAEGRGHARTDYLPGVLDSSRRSAAGCDERAGSVRPWCLGARAAGVTSVVVRLGGCNDELTARSAVLELQVQRGVKFEADGGPGKDSLIGTKGNDKLGGRSGPDRVYGSGGKDSCTADRATTV